MNHRLQQHRHHHPHGHPHSHPQQQPSPVEDLRQRLNRMRDQRDSDEAAGIAPPEDSYIYNLPKHQRHAGYPNEKRAPSLHGHNIKGPVPVGQTEWEQGKVLNIKIQVSEKGQKKYVMDKDEVIKVQMSEGSQQGPLCSGIIKNDNDLSVKRGRGRGTPRGRGYSRGRGGFRGRGRGRGDGRRGRGGRGRGSSSNSSEVNDNTDNSQDLTETDDLINHEGSEANPDGSEGCELSQHKEDELYDDCNGDEYHDEDYHEEQVDEVTNVEKTTETPIKEAIVTENKAELGLDEKQNSTESQSDKTNDVDINSVKVEEEKAPEVIKTVESTKDGNITVKIEEKVNGSVKNEDSDAETKSNVDVKTNDVEKTNVEVTTVEVKSETNN